METKEGSMGSPRDRKGKRVAEKVDNESKSQQLGVSFTDLPSHISTDILLRLPIKSILICKCVCPSWKALISDPHFTKLHFQHASTGFMIRANAPYLVSRILHLLEFEPEKIEKDDDDDQFCFCEDLSIKPECNSHLKLENKLKLPLRDAKLVLDKRDETEKRGRQGHYISSKPEDDKFAVVNSCNGLLCLCDPSRDNFVVCNPVSGEFIRLPKATSVHNISDIWHQEIYCGFGLLPKTNEYKVVRILKMYGGLHSPKTTKFMGVDMYTLGTTTWKNVDVDPENFKWLLMCTDKWLGFPTCVSGALHWIDFYHYAILCFDFESERFQSFPSPPLLFQNKHSPWNITMGELRGSLHICDSSSSSSVSTPVKMWIMKKYGFGESWTKVFSIDTMSRDRWPYGGLYWPVKHFKNGAAILMYHSSNCFIYYEPEKYGFKIFKVRGTQYTFEVIPHIPNLISLKDAVKGDNIEVLNIHSRCAQFQLHEENEVLFLAKVNGEVANVHSISSDDEDD
ncbi:F-box protein At3g07870-like [Lotus japonicus]|uniref:F-box protein At3g07870-like n=1 Tax=Lotus japonicus TaxID=34305 RepID=UPI0025906A90|nr:F-box protein At3g07870-like [Lotus japonicus]